MKAGTKRMYCGAFCCILHGVIASCKSKWVSHRIFILILRKGYLLSMGVGEEGNELAVAERVCVCVCLKHNNKYTIKFLHIWEIYLFFFN